MILNFLPVGVAYSIIGKKHYQGFVKKCLWAWVLFKTVLVKDFT